MKRSQFLRTHRRGLAAVEWTCILAIGTIVMTSGVSCLGDLADEQLTDTATYLGDPASLTQPSDSGDGGEETEGRQKGNNGVGNGEDGQPPGDPPINDGAGTAPGSPGNQGGANR